MKANGRKPIASPSSHETNGYYPDRHSPIDVTCQHFRLSRANGPMLCNEAMHASHILL